MATYKNVSLDEMHGVLSSYGMEAATFDGCKEVVYVKTIKHLGKLLQLRVFTGIEGTGSRKCGSDAIRVVMFAKQGEKDVIVGMTRRVHRTEGWEKNLRSRLDNDWRKCLPRICKKCGAPMREIKKPNMHFFGCSNYPECKYTEEVDSTVAKTPSKTAPAGDPEVLCPTCGQPMVQRRGKYGDFYGCSDFPNCRGTRKVADVERMKEKNADDARDAECDEIGELNAEADLEAAAFFHLT